MSNPQEKKGFTGWMEFIGKHRALYPDKKVDYKALMQEYIKSRQNKEK